MNPDLLTTVLRDTGIARRLLDVSELEPGVAVRFPCERSIGLHVVLRGPVYVHGASGAPIAADSGDIVVMARGCDHLLGLREDLGGARIESITVRGSTTSVDAAVPASGGARVLSGAYQLWHAPLHPFFAEIPAWTVLSGDDVARLSPLSLACGLLEEESRTSAPGSDIALHALLDVVFTYALRAIIARCSRHDSGWSHALLDPRIGRVLTHMHENPAFAWTLDELARVAGLSRTALAERFRDTMGDTPLNHLRLLRMQRAVSLLSSTDQTLEQVAARVGYQDAFSFSKVFKRTLGQSPKTFRQRDGAERDNAWRFAPA